MQCQVQIHVYQGEDEENRGRWVKMSISIQIIFWSLPFRSTCSHQVLQRGD